MILIQEITQALILAGGEGTRLKPITEKIPKSMVEINNKPFLEYQLELMSKNGITNIVLCVGYLWEHIKDYFGDSYSSISGNRINLKYSVEPRFLGTGGAVKNAEKLTEKYFYILYGDTYLPINYQAMGNLIFEKEVMGVISVYENKDKMVNNNVILNEDGIILKYDKTQETVDMNGVEAGASVFNKNILNLLPNINELKSDQKISLEIDIYPKLITRRQLLGYKTEKRFYDMGTPERIKIISEVLK